MKPQWDDLSDADAQLLSKRELSALTGLAPKTIERLTRDGMPTVPGASSRSPHAYDLKACVMWMIQERVAPDDPLARARQRKAEAEAVRLEQLNKKNAGDLVSATEVRRDIAEGMASLRGDLLSIPARMVNLSEEQRAIVKDEIVASVNALSKKVQHEAL